MKCAFTICTYSYLGLAKTLISSFEKYNKGYDFWIVCIDCNGNIEKCILADTLFDKSIDEKELLKRKFQYDITEYSTFVKPFAFKYFFAKNYEKVVYFDPDIMFFSEFTDILDERYSAFVTPHKVFNAAQDMINEEVDISNHGVYNCGFICFNNDEYSHYFIDFWCDRLLDYCYIDEEHGVYTDQKWVDFIHVKMIDRVKIINNIGCNVAPWNLNERLITKVNDEFIVKHDNICSKMVFFHFSGFDYRALLKGEVVHKSGLLKNDICMEELFEVYKNSLNNNKTIELLSTKYRYAFYSNGTVITKLNRRLYRIIKDKNAYGDPFSSEGKFYLRMKRNHLLSNKKVDANKSNTEKIGAKQKLLLLLLRSIKGILGIDKYVEFIRGIHMYSTYEKQYFLVADEDGDNV